MLGRDLPQEVLEVPLERPVVERPRELPRPGVVREVVALVERVPRRVPRLLALAHRFGISVASAMIRYS